MTYTKQVGFRTEKQTNNVYELVLEYKVHSFIMYHIAF